MCEPLFIAKPLSRLHPNWFVCYLLLWRIFIAFCRRCFLYLGELGNNIHGLLKKCRQHIEKSSFIIVFFFLAHSYKVVLVNDQNKQHLCCVTTPGTVPAHLFYTRCESGCGCVRSDSVMCSEILERFCQLLRRCVPKQIISFYLTAWDDKLTPRGLRDDFFLLFTSTTDYATGRNSDTFGFIPPELPFFSVQNVIPVILLYFFFFFCM